MPKSRRFVPDGNDIGKWFQHIGYEEYRSDPQRCHDTSAGIMLTSTFRPEAKYKPCPPPDTYFHKEHRNFKSENDFSYHDNRNTLQRTGEYLGNGKDTRTLGKRIIDCQDRQHYSNTKYLKHHGLQSTDFAYDTTSGSTYQGLPTIEPPRHRRFTKNYSPGDSMKPTLDTTTTQWFDPLLDKYKTPTQVLANSQEPFLKNNTWKYSYNSLERVYPPYNEIKRRHRSKTIVH